MHVSSVPVRSEWIASDLAGLRQTALRILGIGVMSVAWLWLFGLGMTSSSIPDATILLPVVVMIIGGLASWTLTRVPHRVRSAFLVTSMVTGIVLGFAKSQEPIWLFFTAPVCIIASTLLGFRWSAAVALCTSFAACWTSQAMQGTAFPIHLVHPLLLVWLTTLATSLSAWNLRTALEWALDSQQRAWDHTTELRFRRAELRRALHSLQLTLDALERANHELDVARREAEEAYRGKSLFVANISHEFRTPLNIIVGFAEMLCTSPETYGSLTWTAELRHDLTTIWRNAEHLLNMVDDVLDLAQIQVSRLPIFPEPVALHDLVEESLEMAKGLIQGAKLALRNQVSPTLAELYVDRTRVRQVLLNLVSNAIRYTTEGEVVVGAQTDDAGVLVFVRDTGEGIPADRLEQVFLEFEQVDTSSGRPHGGAGLGLAISRHIIRLHGGSIWAESTIGEGTTVFFTVPTHESLDRNRVGRLRKTPESEHKRIEEQAPIMALCEDTLALRILERHMSQPILPAYTPEEAIKAIACEHPRAVMVLPDADQGDHRGQEWAQQILAAAPSDDLTILRCQLPTERRASRQLEVPELLIKPVMRKEVVSAVERLCGQPRCVLMVDDERDMLALLRRMLETEWPDVQVMQATRGPEALRLARQCPDVILLDLLMPEMSGSEVLGLLREDVLTADIPVAVLTARGPAETEASSTHTALQLYRRRSLSRGGTHSRGGSGCRLPARSLCGLWPGPTCSRHLMN